MDNRNRLLNEAYREYNDRLSFMLHTLSDIIRTQQETQTANNNSLRSIFALLHSTILNMDTNHNAIINNIRESYPLITPIRSTATTIPRSSEPVFNNNNRALFRTRNSPTTRGRFIPGTMLTPLSPNRLRLSRDFLGDGGNNQQMDTLSDMINSFQINIQNLQNVHISPSLRQIQTATRCYNYTMDELEDDPELRCPITHEEFEINEEVCIIKHCNHKFKKEPLYQWFNSNVRCPICRFDIRDYVEREIPEEENNDISFNDLSMNSINTDEVEFQGFDTLRDALRDAVREMDPGNIVSLELPIPINRTNSGTLSDFFRDLSNNVI